MPLGLRICVLPLLLRKEFLRITRPLLLLPRPTLRLRRSRRLIEGTAVALVQLSAVLHFVLGLVLLSSEKVAPTLKGGLLILLR